MNSRRRMDLPSRSLIEHVEVITYQLLGTGD
jgi:hypothetical protein